MESEQLPVSSAKRAEAGGPAGGPAAADAPPDPVLSLLEYLHRYRRSWRCWLIGGPAAVDDMALVSTAAIEVPWPPGRAVEAWARLRLGLYHMCSSPVHRRQQVSVSTGIVGTQGCFFHALVASWAVLLPVAVVSGKGVLRFLPAVWFAFFFLGLPRLIARGWTGTWGRGCRTCSSRPRETSGCTS